LCSTNKKTEKVKLELSFSSSGKCDQKRAFFTQFFDAVNLHNRCHLTRSDALPSHGVLNKQALPKCHRRFQTAIKSWRFEIFVYSGY
jgi:uncharacterized protein YggL (DUF469 family)